jgi:hypothetical protein
MKAWTAQDIEQMKSGFLKGTPIKILARELDRTPTALNKALSRFSIRNPRPEKPKSIWNDFGQTHTNQSSHRLTSLKKIDRHLQRTHRMKEHNIWVVMDDVLSLLDKRLHTVYLLKSHSDPRECLYYFDGDRVSALKLIFVANRYRINDNKSPFCVEGITL